MSGSCHLTVGSDTGSTLAPQLVHQVLLGVIEEHMGQEKTLNTTRHSYKTIITITIVICKQ